MTYEPAILAHSLGQTLRSNFQALHFMSAPSPKPITGFHEGLNQMFTTPRQESMTQTIQFRDIGTLTGQKIKLQILCPAHNS